MEKHIILLHGALGSRTQFDELIKHLTGFNQIHAFNFMGHGGISIPDNLVMPGFLWQLENYIEQHIPKDAELTLFGYSVGGYAALLLASKNSFKIAKVVTLGTKLLWTEEIARREAAMLNPSTIEEKIPQFANELKERHAPVDWKTLLLKTADMMHDLGINEYLNDDSYSKINIPCKLMIGDKDRMVSLDETSYAHRKIKNASIVVLPNTPHPIEKVNVERLVFELLK